MGIKIEHVQYLNDLRMILGATYSVIQFTAPFTDKEFLRGIIDPGFNGSVDFFEADLQFHGGVTVIQNVTWKWQVREAGGSTWVDLHNAVTEQWSGDTNTGIRVGLTASALGANADAFPLEFRLIVSAATAATIKVMIGAGYETPAVRLVGESA